jgi:hypothetical protein
VQTERVVRLARMEVQRVLETVRPFAANFEELKTATTGILEYLPPAQMECEYCVVRHRKGDCLLPWARVGR